VADRPVFIPQTEGSSFVLTKYVSFEWFAGMSIKQKQRSIEALHSAAKHSLGVQKVLDISTKSPDPLGVALSAFNLQIHTKKHGRVFSVESAYQGSKVFERGGPYRDLLNVPPIEAKRDSRLLSSGRLIGFRFFGTDWGLEPRTAFYDWLYINALHKSSNCAEGVIEFDAFTDIAFNPERSINCQGYSAALYVALVRRDLLSQAIASKENFLFVMGGAVVSNAHDDQAVQEHLRLGNR
jgi:hypothetical protein